MVSTRDHHHHGRIRSLNKRKKEHFVFLPTAIVLYTHPINVQRHCWLTRARYPTEQCGPHKLWVTSILFFFYLFTVDLYRRVCALQLFHAWIRTSSELFPVPAIRQVQSRIS